MSQKLCPTCVPPYCSTTVPHSKVVSLLLKVVSFLLKVVSLKLTLTNLSNGTIPLIHGTNLSDPRTFRKFTGRSEHLPSLSSQSCKTNPTDPRTSHMTDHLMVVNF